VWLRCRCVGHRPTARLAAVDRIANFVLTIATPNAIDQNVIEKRAAGGRGTVLWRTHKKPPHHWRPVTMYFRPAGLSLLSSAVGDLGRPQLLGVEKVFEIRLTDGYRD
jgi:hypothetical protein